MIKFNSKYFLKYFYAIKFLFNHKDPCIRREHSLNIHDVVNDQGFAMHYRAISNMVKHSEVFLCGRQYDTGKAKVRIDFFSHVEYFRSKQIFQYDVEKDMMCDKLIVIDRQHREMRSPLGQLNQNFC